MNEGMKINLYQRQHPSNLIHAHKSSNFQHTPYSMTSSYSSVDFNPQGDGISQVVVCEGALFITKGLPSAQNDEKPQKVRLKIDKGVLQFTDYHEGVQAHILYDLNYESPYIEKICDSYNRINQIYLSSAESYWTISSEDVHILDELYTFLKNWAISSDFDQIYRIVESLYESSHFSVISIKRKSDDSFLVAKSFPIGTELECTRNLSMLLKDIRTNRLIDHSKYSKIKEIHETKACAYLVYDCEFSTTLENYVNKNGPLEDSDTKIIIRRLIKSLNYLHKKLNTSYRNLRPSLIMLSPATFDIQLIDLAFSLDHSRANESKKNPPPGYLAPEILKAKKETINSDVFSLGAIMYFCVTGRHPFLGKDVIEINTNNKRCVITFPKRWLQVDDEAKDLIKKMLNPHTYLRPDLDDVETHNWLFDVSQIEATQLLGDPRTNNFKHIQIYKNRKTYRKLQADEEDAKRGDSHLIFDLMKPMINNGVMKNPFSPTAAIRRQDLVKSLTVGYPVQRRKKDSLSIDTKHTYASADQEPSESLKETYLDEHIPEDDTLLHNKLCGIFNYTNKHDKSPFFKDEYRRVAPIKFNSDFVPKTNPSAAREETQSDNANKAKSKRKSRSKKRKDSSSKEKYKSKQRNSSKATKKISEKPSFN